MSEDWLKKGADGKSDIPVGDEVKEKEEPRVPLTEKEAAVREALQKYGTLFKETERGADQLARDVVTKLKTNENIDEFIKQLPHFDKDSIPDDVVLKNMMEDISMSQDDIGAHIFNAGGSGTDIFNDVYGEF